MKMKLCTAAALLASLPSLLAASSVYNTNIDFTYAGNGVNTVTGTITTDGATGILTKADILAINLTINAGGVTAPATKLSDFTYCSCYFTAVGNTLEFIPLASGNGFTLSSDGTTGFSFYVQAVNTLEQVEFDNSTNLTLDYLTFSDPATIFIGSLAPAATSTPEPASYALIAMGGLSFLSLRKLRNRRRA